MSELSPVAADLVRGVVGLGAVVYMIVQRGRPREVINRGAARTAPAGAARATESGTDPADPVQTTADAGPEQRSSTPPDDGGRPPAG